MINDKKLKIEIAKSKSKKIPKDKEFQDFFQTKRINELPKEIDIQFCERK